MGFELTWFDYVAFVVIGLSALMAFARGLLREAFSVVAFVGALIAGIFLRAAAGGIVEKFTNLRGDAGQVAGGVAIFLIIYIGITVIVHAVAKNIHRSTEIGSFDRAAGLAFGVVRGLILGALFALLVRAVAPNYKTSPGAALAPMVNAAIYPVFDSIAGVLVQVWPRVKDRAHDIIEQQSDSQRATIPPAEPAPQPDSAGAPKGQ